MNTKGRALALIEGEATARGLSIQAITSNQVLSGANTPYLRPVEIGVWIIFRKVP
jgi:hypothetical protein